MITRTTTPRIAANQPKRKRPHPQGVARREHEEEALRGSVHRPPETGVERDDSCKRAVRSYLDNLRPMDRKTRAAERKRLTEVFLRMFPPVSPPSHAERAEREERRRQRIAEAYVWWMDGGPAAHPCGSGGSPGCHDSGERTPLDGLAGLLNGRAV